MYLFLLNVLPPQPPLFLLSRLLKIISSLRNHNIHPSFNSLSRIVWCLKTLRKIELEDFVSNLINWYKSLEINGTIFWIKNLNFYPRMLYTRFVTIMKKNGSSTMIESIEVERNSDLIDFLSTQQTLLLCLNQWSNLQQAALWLLRLLNWTNDFH
jgi:hypothetical protein